MCIRSLLAGVALLALCVTQAQAQQGNLPKPVQALPAYPPVVCVTPKWEREPCESRKDPLGEFFEFLGFLDRIKTTWLMIAFQSDQPGTWNGAWPAQKLVLREMGYRKCEKYEAPPPMTTPSKTTMPRLRPLQNVDGKEWQAATQRSREWIKGQ